MPSYPSAIAAVLFAAILAISADAATSYNVTGLGTSYSLPEISTGENYLVTSAVTSGDGSQTFAFEKSPVSYTYSNPTPAQALNSPDNFGYFTISSPTGGTIGYTLSTVQGTTNSIEVMQFLPNWETVGNGEPPISDINSSGSIVGQQYGNAVIAPFQGLLVPPFDASPTILDGEIAASLNIHLTDALWIDDLGDIIAMGTRNGQDQYFLLTPTTAPEPSTLGFLGVGIVLLAIRARRRS